MNKLNKKRRQFIFISLLIPVTLLIAFVVFPAIDLFRMSFTDWDGFSADYHFINFENYISMFRNKDLWLSLRNNAVYFVIHLFMILVELAFAVLLTSKLRAAKFYKTMVFLPYIINGVAISYAFSYFFSPINGAFNGILTALHLESLIRNWLSDEKIVNFVLASVSVWRFSGYHVILFMAALQSIPTDILEAARIDGASELYSFHRIALPIMSPGIATMSIMAFIGNWNNYLLPMIILNKNEKFTLPVMMATLKASTDIQRNQGAIYLAVAISVIPILIVFCFCSKYIISSISAGSVKE